MRGAEKHATCLAFAFTFNFADRPRSQGKIKKLEVEARESEARQEAHKHEREDLENRLAEAEVLLFVGGWCGSRPKLKIPRKTLRFVATWRVSSSLCSID